MAGTQKLDPDIVAENRDHQSKPVKERNLHAYRNFGADEYQEK